MGSNKRVYKIAAFAGSLKWGTINVKQNPSLSEIPKVVSNQHANIMPGFGRA